MISNYDRYRNRLEIKPVVDCLDILTELCGIVTVDSAMRVMNEQFDPNATTTLVYELIDECARDYEPAFGTWTYLGINYFTHGSLTAASCDVAEFYRAKHQIYTYDEKSGEYIGEYGPPNYDRAQAERLEYLKHLVLAHKDIDFPTDLNEYLEKGVVDALFDRPVAKKLHKVARAKRRDKMTTYIAEQAIKRNIRYIIGCDGTSDVWVPLLVDTIVAHTAVPLRDKLDIPEIKRLTLEMFQTFPKWENNGRSDEQMNKGRRNVHVCGNKNNDQDKSRTPIA